VRASQRLTTSASCLVAGSHGPDRELERLLARQNRGAGTKPILEITCAIPWSRRFRRQRLCLGFIVSAAGAGANPRRRTAGRPAAFANRLNQLVLRGVGKETG